MRLINLFLDKYERSTKWNGIKEGNVSLRIEENDYKIIGKALLIKEAIELEQRDFIKIVWVKGYYNQDIEKVTYSLTDIQKFYELAERIPKYQLVEEQKNLALALTTKLRSSWIKDYISYEKIAALEKGNYDKDMDKLKLLYQCLEGLDKLELPVYKRVFSKRYLKNSKLFEKQLQSVIINIAKKYNPTVEEDMDDSEVLFQLSIEEYSQELNLKGCLELEVDGIRLNTGENHYGTVLNTQTLKNAKIMDTQLINKILTIENKANFVAQPYEKGTLILFFHGYFTPVERNFLIQLREKLEGQPVTYYHNGDLDYGGVRIFQYIKHRIFPELQPYKMDVETFNQYLNYGEPMEEELIDKLKKCKEPCLSGLIERIIETGMVIEQEVYL